MTKITVWNRIYKDGYDFNHISDGHLKGLAPTPRCSHQSRAWKDAKWFKYHACLIDGVVRAQI